MQNTHLLTVFLFYFFTNQLIFAQPFEVDVTFGENGEVLLPNIQDVGFSSKTILIQSDDKVLVLLNNIPQIIRLDKSGQLDTDFGENGMATISIDKIIFIREIAIQADNKIVIVGSVQDEEDSGVSDALIVRFCEDGMVDDTFGDKGGLVLDQEFVPSAIQTVVFQADNKIILAGHSNNRNNDGLSDRDFMLIRLYENGGLDETFGNNGVVLSDFGSLSEFYRDVEIKENGKIIATGFAKNKRGNDDFIINQFNTDGSVDSTFGIKGQSLLDVNGGNDHVE